MAEDTVSAERFPVVRGDDDQRPVEQPLASQLVEQPAELVVQEGDAIVVAVAGHDHVPSRDHGLQVSEIGQELIIARGPGTDAETARIARRGHIRIVGVEAVHEGEERAIRPPPAQPVEEGVVDPARVAGLEADPLPVVEVAAAEDVPEDPAPGDRAAQQESRRERIVLVMREAAIQPGLVTAIGGVRNEARGLIASRGQVSGQRGGRGIERVLPVGIELVRPPTGEEAAMRGERPVGRRHRRGITDAVRAHRLR